MKTMVGAPVLLVHIICLLLVHTIGSYDIHVDDYIESHLDDIHGWSFLECCFVDMDLF